jgi:hypothetical protein
MPTWLHMFNRQVRSRQKLALKIGVKSQNVVTLPKNCRQFPYLLGNLETIHGIFFFVLS